MQRAVRDGRSRCSVRFEQERRFTTETIRRAIIDSASQLQRRARLAAEAAALEADEVDRREMLEVAALMESVPASR